MDSYGGGYGQYVPASSTEMANSLEMVKDFGALLGTIVNKSVSLLGINANIHLSLLDV